MSTPVPLARNRKLVNKLLYLNKLLVRQARRVAVLGNTIDVCRAWDGNGSLLADPTNRNLSRRHTLALGHGLYRFNKLEVLRKGFWLETRQHPAEVIGREIPGRAQRARKPSAAYGAVSNDGDANWTCWSVEYPSPGLFGPEHLRS